MLRVSISPPSPFYTALPHTSPPWNFLDGPLLLKFLCYKDMLKMNEFEVCRPSPPTIYKSSITTLPMGKCSLYFQEDFIHELLKIRRHWIEEFTCCLFECVEQEDWYFNASRRVSYSPIRGSLHLKKRRTSFLSPLPNLQLVLPPKLF